DQSTTTLLETCSNTCNEKQITPYLVQYCSSAPKPSPLATSRKPDSSNPGANSAAGALRRCGWGAVAAVGLALIL
ncbi:hypothetical protein HDU96_004241, partial [Phlyctochytrium bullatum]